MDAYRLWEITGGTGPFQTRDAFGRFGPVVSEWEGAPDIRAALSAIGAPGFKFDIRDDAGEAIQRRLSGLTNAYARNILLTRIGEDILLPAFRQNIREGELYFTPLAPSTVAKKARLSYTSPDTPLRTIDESSPLYQSLYRDHAYNVFQVRGTSLVVGSSHPHADYAQNGFTTKNGRFIVRPFASLFRGEEKDVVDLIEKFIDEENRELGPGERHVWKRL